jgi:hypothetical protein
LNPIFAAALEVQRVCDEAAFPFCFIGGVAVQRWGEPRLTADVDLTLLTGFGTEAPYVDRLLASFVGRLADARTFALEHRTLLLRSSEGIAIDVSLGAMPFEEASVARASMFELGAGVRLRTCSAEDLIVHKAFAARDKDWLDVRGIVKRQRGKLDAALVWAELLPLLELVGDSDREKRLRALFV